MGKVHEAESTIEASRNAIWEILTDGAGWADWDSGVISVEGSIAPDEQIKITSEVNPKRAFPIKVTEFKPNERMVLTGGMPLGLFKGVRTYSLTPLDGGNTRFTMHEQYSGLLSPLMTRMIPDMQASFEQFANGLKAKAESAG